MICDLKEALICDLIKDLSLILHLHWYFYCMHAAWYKKSLQHAYNTNVHVRIVVHVSD